MYRIEKVEELLREISEPAPKGNFNLVLLGEDGVGKEYYAREIHQKRKDKDKFLLVDFEVEHSTQKEQIELLVTGGPECFLRKAQTNTFFLRRLDFLDQRLIRQLQNLFRQASSLLCDKTFHFMKLGILSSANVRALRLGNGILKNLLDEFFMLQVQIPPLRERKLEFYDLIRKMASRSHANCVPTILQVFVDYQEISTSYHWPGNLNELQSWIDRICTIDGIEDINLRTLFQPKPNEKVVPIRTYSNNDEEEKSKRLKECQNLIACCSYYS